MRFAFVYDQTEDDPPTGGPLPHTQGRHPRSTPRPAARIALATGEPQARAHLGSDRARACLNRLLYTVSTLDMDSDLTPVRATGAMDSDELFRPQAFNASSQEGRS